MLAALRSADAWFRRVAWGPLGGRPLPLGVVLARARAGWALAHGRLAAMPVLLLLSAAAMLGAWSLLDTLEPAARGRSARPIAPASAPWRVPPVPTPRIVVPRFGPLAAVGPSPEPTAVPSPPATLPCGFIAGFAALAAELGRGVVGECAENENAEAAARVSRQRTTLGEFVWFRDTGTVSFSDRETTRYRCSWGIERRPVAERPPC